jgi:hypothetical protein
MKRNLALGAMLVDAFISSACAHLSMTCSTWPGTCAGRGAGPKRSVTMRLLVAASPVLLLVAGSGWSTIMLNLRHGGV